MSRIHPPANDLPTIDFFTAMEISASSLAAQRARMNIASSNLATVARTTQDPGPPRLEYDPGHPDANAQGDVAYRSVGPVEEMVDMLTASHRELTSTQV